MPKYTFTTPRGLYHIEHDAKPIPDRQHDWDWWHDDYDGGMVDAVTPSRDPRCGTAGSVVGCIEAILELEDEE